MKTVSKNVVIAAAADLASPEIMSQMGFVQYHLDLAGKLAARRSAEEALASLRTRLAARAAKKVAKTWPTEIDGSPIRGVEGAIMARMGLGRDTYGQPVASEGLLAAVRQQVVRHFPKAR